MAEESEKRYQELVDELTDLVKTQNERDKQIMDCVERASKNQTRMNDILVKFIETLRDKKSVATCPHCGFTFEPGRPPAWYHFRDAVDKP